MCRTSGARHITCAILPNRSTSAIRGCWSICAAIFARPCAAAWASLPPLMRGLFPPQVLNRLLEVDELVAADPTPAEQERVVCQGYAQLLQGCLGRSSHSRFDLSGQAVYADVQALVELLERCLAQQAEPTLLEWHTRLQAIVAEYRTAFGEVAQAQSWLLAIREVLDSAALPSAEAAGAGGDAVARELAQVLGWLAD